MAQQITCDMCGQEAAQVMQTNLTNGDSIAVGATCLLPLLLTMAETITSEMPADVAAQYGEALAPVIGKLLQTVATAEITAATPARPKRPRKTAGKPIVLHMEDERADSDTGAQEPAELIPERIGDE